MNEMKKIISCPCCGNPEFYGKLYWSNGKEYCRRCIYEIWEKENNQWNSSWLDKKYPHYDKMIHNDLTALYLAKYIIYYYDKIQKPKSNRFINIMLFIIKQYYLFFDIELFGDNFIATRLCPIVPDVYYKYFSSGTAPIHYYEKKDELKIPEEIKNVINLILENYSDKTFFHVRNEVLINDDWYMLYDCKLNGTINNDSIKRLVSSNGYILYPYNTIFDKKERTIFLNLWYGKNKDNTSFKDMLEKNTVKKNVEIVRTINNTSKNVELNNELICEIVDSINNNINPRLYESYYKYIDKETINKINKTILNIKKI